jgi:hypothetical protein
MEIDMKLKVLLMTMVFAVSMVAQTAAPSPAPKGDDKNATCSCPDCANCCKDGKCASGGKCCGEGAKCVRKPGDKTAKADCCAGKKDCCKDGKCMKDGKCCGDMAKGEMAMGDMAKKDGKSCCGGKCDRKAHDHHEAKTGE